MGVIALNGINIEKLYELVQKKGLKVVSNGIETLPFWKNGDKFFTIEGPK